MMKRRKKLSREKRSDTWSPPNAPYGVAVGDIYINFDGHGGCDEKKFVLILQELRKELTDWGRWEINPESGCGGIILHTKLGDSRSLIYQTMTKINRILSKHME